MPSETAKDIFLDALEQDEPQRASYVALRCDGDPRLEESVVALLSAHDGAGRFLGDPAGPALTGQTMAIGFSDGAQIGQNYKIVRRLGEGGFGVVYLAEQTQPIRRQVAIKVIKAGMDTRQVIARFEAERQALALMDHPHIARVMDAGATEDGRPFFVMEYVAGVPIDSYCREQQLDLRARVKLVQDVCRAVQHAHHKGILHRDIKPSNVLVAESDGEPVVKVIDFGVAKATSQRLTEETLFTQTGQLVGTPSYMSPEQAGSEGDVDTRSDVYALGVLLYELITGTPPFDPQIMRQEGFAEMLRVVREVDPPRPSVRLAALNAAAAKTEDLEESMALGRDLQSDLDWITMKCLEKDRGLRYETPAALSQELDRFLHGRPVQAGPPSARYRVHKFVSRHRVGIVVAVAFVALLVGATVTSTLLALRAQEAEQDATNEAQRAQRAEQAARDEAKRAQLELGKYESIAKVTQEILGGIDPAEARGQDTTLLRKILDGAESRVLATLEDQPEVEAAVRDTLAYAYFSIGELETAVRQGREVVELNREAFGPEHDETLTSLKNLTIFLLKMSRHEQAEIVCREALAIREQVSGAEDRRTLELLDTLAAIHQQTGREAEAIEMFRRVYDARLRTLGETHNETITSLNNLGNALAKSDHKEAADLLEKALALQEERHTPEHPKVLSTMNNLAMAYQEAGRLEDAAALLERSLEVKKRVLPDNHPSTLVGLNNLATILKDLGREEEALPIRTRVVAICREHMGPEHQYTWISLMNLGNLYRSLDRFEESLEALVETDQLMSVKLGLDHPHRLIVRDSQANTLRELGRLAEALALSQEVLETALRKFPDDARRLAPIQRTLGRILSRMERFEESEPALLEAYRLFVDFLGAEHRQTQITAQHLAEMYEKWGKANEATVWSERSRPAP